MRVRDNFVRAAMGALIAACLCVPPSAGAQAVAEPAASAAASVLPEVVVTAERVDTLERKTPVSVGVLDSGAIDSRGLYQLKDLAGTIAGVTVPNGDSNMPQAVGIRGVGVSIPAMSQAVGIYIDDVPLVRGYATAVWDLPDIERIEVLKGPQGTLYGQNTTAGAVKYISVDPSNDAVGWVSISGGNYGAREVHGYGSGELGDGPLSASIAFSDRKNDGFGYNATLDERINKTDASQFRAKFRLNTDSSTNIVLAVDGLRDLSDLNTLNYPLNAPESAPRVSYTSVDAGAFKRDAGGIQLKVEQKLSQNIDFRSITSYRAYRDDPSVVDYGGLVIQRFGLSQVVRQNAFSQELQLNGHAKDVTWTAGAMFVQDQFDFDRFTVALPPSAPAPSYNEAKTHLETTDIGVYGQARYVFAPDTGLTLGIRAYDTHQKGANDFWITNQAEARTSVVYAASGLSTESGGVLPRLGLDRQWNPYLFSYVSIAQGEKFGGFNRAAQSLTSAEYAAKPEKVTTYEFGNKARLFGGKVSASVALFYNDYRNYLAALTNEVIDGVLVSDSVLVNAGKAKTYGADFDITVQLTADTSATLSSEWLRSRFVTFSNPTGSASGDYVGNQLPYAPRASLGSSIVHTERLSNGSEAKFDVAVQYLQKQFSDVGNTVALGIPTQIYLNAGATYYFSGPHWSVSLRAKNIANKTYVLINDSIPQLGVSSALYNDPRTLLLTLRYDL